MAGWDGRVNIRKDLLSNLRTFSLPTDVFVDGRGAVPQMTAVPGGQNGGDLGDDGQGYFLRRLAAEIEPSRGVQRRQVRWIDLPAGVQLLQQMPVPFAWAEQAGIRELHG